MSRETVVSLVEESSEAKPSVENRVVLKEERSDDVKFRARPRAVSHAEVG
jgi:hypothetical protein